MVKLTQIDDESATRFDQVPAATHAAKEETFNRAKKYHTPVVFRTFWHDDVMSASNKRQTCMYLRQHQLNMTLAFKEFTGTSSRFSVYIYNYRCTRIPYNNIVGPRLGLRSFRTQRSASLAAPTIMQGIWLLRWGSQPKKQLRRPVRPIVPYIKKRAMIH